MPQAIPIIIAAAGQVAAGAGYAYAAVALQIAAAASAVIIANQQARKAKRAMSAQTRDHSVTIQSANEPHRTIYGRAKVGGPLVFATSEGPDQKFMHRVVAVASHEIDAWEKFFLNDDELVLPGLPATANYSAPVAGGRYTENGLPVVAIETRMGTVGQPWMSIAGGQWTVDHRCDGRALMRVQTNYTPNVFTEGLPNPSTVIRGKKLFDNRTGLTVWSRNSALVIRDYLLNVLKVDPTSIDQTSFDAAANVCDEDITVNSASTGDPTGWAAYLAAGAQAFVWTHGSGSVYTQKRYTCNGVVFSDTDPGDVLQHMVGSCAGYLSYTGGMYRLVAGSYTAPTLTLTERDLRGAVSVRPRPGRRDRYNEARGTFIGPLNQWQPTDFPVVKAPAFVTADGGEVAPLDFDFPFTDEAIMAQRLATIGLLRSRQGVVSVPCTLTALALRPGDTVALTVPALGFNASVFRVEGWEFTEDFGINLALREESADVYVWTPDLTVKDPSPNLNLPTPWVVADIAGLAAESGVAHALIQNDGTILPRTLVSWTGTTNAFNRFVEIEIQQFGETTWMPQPRAIDNNHSTYLLGMHTGVLYSIRVRRVNSVGSVGLWNTIDHVVLDVNAIDNLLSNSDWVEDLGSSQSGAGAEGVLRDWNSIVDGLATVTNFFGRNYANGSAWNVGQGGAWMYTTTRVGAGTGSLLLYEIALVQPSQTYECSVYISAHRCRASLFLRFLDVNGTFISPEYGPDEIDAGAGIIGGAFDPLVSHRRLWLKATAPPSTVYAQVILRHWSTNVGQPDSYSFWSKSLLCIAPTGVTRATATPWLTSETVSLRGLGVPLSSTANGGNSDWGTSVSSIYTWTTKTNIVIGLRAGDTILIDCEFQGVSGTTLGAAQTAAAAIHVNQGGITWTIAFSKVNEMGWVPYSGADAIAVKCQHEYTTLVDQTVTVHGAGGAHFANTGTGNGRVLLRVYRVRK